MHRFLKVCIFLPLTIWLVACSGQPAPDTLQPGTTLGRELVTANDGLTRTYRLHVPSNYQADKEWPLVVAIHGAYSSPEYHERRTGFSRVADQEGFIVLYPTGIDVFGHLRFWNAGHCCGRALAKNVDDAGFILAAIDDAAAAVNIDRSRIYVTGFSNGGMLAHLIGAQYAESVAAIAPVAGAIGGSESPEEPVWRIPAADRPLPVMLVHGVADDVVPYAGGPRSNRPGGQQYLSVQDSTEYWRQQNGCTATHTTETGYDGLLELQRWQECAAGSEVSVWSLKQWRHIWPGPDDPTTKQQVDLHGFDAALAIWHFFREHQLPQ